MYAADHEATLLLFADDKTLYAGHNNWALAAQVSTNALQALSEALVTLGLSINAMKTKSMFISQPLTSEGGVERVIHSGNPLEVVSQIRCLGLMIDDRLSWTHYVDSVIAKVSRKIGALKRVRKQLSLQARRQFFLSVIHPDFEYCAPVFITSLPASERQRLLATYRRAVRATAEAHLHDYCDVLPRQLRHTPANLPHTG